MNVVAAEHPNATRMREVAEAVGRGDVRAALEYFPEDVVWYWPAARKEERVYRGRAGLSQFFARVHERSMGVWEPKVVDVLGSDDYVVIFLRVTAEYDHDQLDILVAHFATVGPGGFARNWFLPNDVAAMNRFFGYEA
jgi:ketosteroid isomerase-like protein